jgi:ribose 5-phosphate isomerase
LVALAAARYHGMMRTGDDPAIEAVAARASELVPDGATVGLGSGRAAAAFVARLGARVGQGLHRRHQAERHQPAHRRSARQRDHLDRDATALAIPGVVDTGLFLGTAERVLVGYPDGRVDVLGGAP